jgi:hypothetical protein
MSLPPLGMADRLNVCMATHGAEMEGTIFYITPNFNFVLCNRRKLPALSIKYFN